MIILENDDTTFSIKETLYLGEKLAVPVVFDLHHHMMNNDGRSGMKMGTVSTVHRKSSLYH